MPDPQTQAARTAPSPTKPVIPSGQEIFDKIMQEIEPDLISTNVNTLEEKYGAEPEEEKKARLEKYKLAFAEYDKKYKVYMDDLTKRVAEYTKYEMKKIEVKNKEKEQEVLADLEASIMSI